MESKSIMWALKTLKTEKFDMNRKVVKSVCMFEQKGGKECMYVYVKFSISLIAKRTLLPVR